MPGKSNKTKPPGGIPLPHLHLHLPLPLPLTSDLCHLPSASDLSEEGKEEEVAHFSFFLE